MVPALDPGPTAAELQVYCAGHLARFKVPTVELTPELPHSATGKVRKREIVAAVLFFNGRNRLKQVRPLPETKRSLEEDKEWAKNLRS